MIAEYCVKTVYLNENGDEVTASSIGIVKKLEAAYTKDGKYIGTPELARYLCVEHGVVPESLPCDFASLDVCSIGFSEREQRWYGWDKNNHMSFGIGDGVTIGSPAYRPESRTEFMEMICGAYERNPQYDNVKVRAEVDGLIVICDSKINDQLSGITCNDPALLEMVKEIFGEIPEIKTETETYFVPYPMKFGNGTWFAETLGDARQMAIDYAEAFIN